jgi:hypothetical protein
MHLSSVNAARPYTTAAPMPRPGVAYDTEAGYHPPKPPAQPPSIYPTPLHPEPTPKPPVLRPTSEF